MLNECNILQKHGKVSIWLKNSCGIPGSALGGRSRKLQELEMDKHPLPSEFPPCSELALPGLQAPPGLLSHPSTGTESILKVHELKTRRDHSGSTIKGKTGWNYRY